MRRERRWRDTIPNFRCRSAGSSLVATVHSVARECALVRHVQAWFSVFHTMKQLSVATGSRYPGLLAGLHCG